MSFSKHAKLTSDGLYAQRTSYHRLHWAGNCRFRVRFHLEQKFVST